jgi:hypothetical protein
MNYQPGYCGLSETTLRNDRCMVVACCPRFSANVRECCDACINERKYRPISKAEMQQMTQNTLWCLQHCQANEQSSKKSKMAIYSAAVAKCRKWLVLIQ